MSRTFYTSDLHLGHAFVAGLRGHAAASDWDQAFVDTWTTTVTKRDTVWILGDVALGGWRAALDLLSSLPGEKHLVSGNHDTCHPMHIGAHSRTREYLRAFASVQPFARKKIAGSKVLMSHFPVAGDHTEGDRHKTYRLRPFNGFLLHGHTHGPERVTTAGPTTQIHVGLDAWDFDLVPEHVVADIITASSL